MEPIDLTKNYSLQELMTLDGTINALRMLLMIGVKRPKGCEQFITPPDQRLISSDLATFRSMVFAAVVEKCKDEVQPEQEEESPGPDTEEVAA